MKVSYEVKSGVTQVALFVPLSVLAMVASSVIVLGLGAVDAYHQATWAHGRSVDFDLIHYHLNLLGRLLEAQTLEEGIAWAVTCVSPNLSLLSWVSVWIQNIALVGVCGLIAVGAHIARRAFTGDTRSVATSLADTFALRPVGARWIAVGLLGGLALTWAPSALMQVVLAYVDLDNTSGRLIAETMRHSTPAVAAFGLFTLGVLVPLLEELVFRGFLWHAGERWMAPALLLVLTALVFAAFHMSPAHVLGVIWHAFFLGWLRYTSGSLVPPVLAHMGNNLLAGALMTLGIDTDESTSAAVSVAMFTVGLVGVGSASYAAWRLRAPVSSSGA